MLYLEDLPADKLQKKFFEIERALKLNRRRNYKFEIDHGKRSTFCYDFANVNFCLRVRGSHKSIDYFNGFIVINIDKFEDEGLSEKDVINNNR